MIRTANPAPAGTAQLELPLGQQATVRDLSYYIGLGKVFAAYHKRWPTAASTREEFRAARVPGHDGQRVDRELRFPAPALEADPAYRALRARCLADGMADGVTLAALDPRYRTVLNDDDIGALFDSIVLPRPGDPGAVRYATGVPAHRPGELTLHVGDATGAQALALAGLDPADARVRAAGFALRVQAGAGLEDFIERAGVCGPAGHGPLADHYLLEAGDDGRLFLKCQLLSVVRYAGSFAVGDLARRLAAVYRADPLLAGLRAAAPPDRPPAPAIPAIAASAAAPAPDSDEELGEQLAALEPEGGSLGLPIQELSRFADIRRLLEQAGAVFSAQRQRFDVEDGVDPARVLEQVREQLREQVRERIRAQARGRLLSGGAP